MKQQGVPFLYAIISFAYFETEKDFFPKYIEAEQEIRHAYI